MEQQVGTKRDLYNGFGDAMARAVEFAAAPVIFGVLGHWLDGRFGTSPIFLIALVLFAAAGVGVRTYYEYAARMDDIAARSPWRATDRTEP